MTLSRYPIVADDFLGFEKLAHSDSWTNKGVLYVKLDIDGKPLHVFNTHLCASYIDKDAGALLESMNCRLAEMKEICQFILEKTSN